MDLFRIMKLSAAIICLFMADIYSKKAIFSWVGSAIKSGKKHAVHNLFGQSAGLNIVNMKNHGISFSLFSNFQAARVVICIVCIAIITYLLKELQKSRNNLQTTALVLIIGGALGNLYDRIFLGSVRDFIDFFVGQYHWPAFNLGDTFVCVGGFMYILNQIINKNEKNGKKSAKK